MNTLVCWRQSLLRKITNSKTNTHVSAETNRDKTSNTENVNNVHPEYLYPSYIKTTAYDVKVLK